MPSLKHVHQYVRYKDRKGYFRCADPLCSHFAPRELTLGKMSRCNLCGSEFILSNRDLELAVPRCLNCANTKKARAFRAAKAIANDLLEREDGTTDR